MVNLSNFLKIILTTTAIYCGFLFNSSAFQILSDFEMRQIKGGKVSHSGKCSDQEADCSSTPDCSGSYPYCFKQHDDYCKKEGKIKVCDDSSSVDDCNEHGGDAKCGTTIYYMCVFNNKLTGCLPMYKDSGGDCESGKDCQ